MFYLKFLNCRLCDVPVAYEPSLFKKVREGKVVTKSSYDQGPKNDGYRWRKYGQKNVKGSLSPRYGKLYQPTHYYHALILSSENKS